MAEKHGLLTEMAPPSRLPAREEPFVSAEIDHPCLALTFDDGPHPVLTRRLLKHLAARAIRATFFVIGENVHFHPDLLQRAAAEGHEIGNHSWSHPKFLAAPDAAVQDELRRTAEHVAEITGTAPRLVRAPFGESTEAQRQWIRHALGCTVVQWSLDPNDWRQPGTDAITQRVLDGARNGSVILLHDVQVQTVEAIPSILDGLLAKGFQFSTISELITLHQSAAENQRRKQEAEKQSADRANFPEAMEANHNLRAQRERGCHISIWK